MIVDAFLDQSLAVVLIHGVNFDLVLGQFYVLDQEPYGAGVSAVEDLPQRRDSRGIEIEVHMEKELEARRIFVTIGTESLARMAVIFEEITPKDRVEEILTKGHGVLRPYAGARDSSCDGPSCGCTNTHTKR